MNSYILKVQIKKLLTVESQEFKNNDGLTALHVKAPFWLRIFLENPPSTIHPFSIVTNGGLS